MEWLGEWLGDLEAGLGLILALALLAILNSRVLLLKAMNWIRSKLKGSEKDTQIIGEEIKMLSSRPGTGDGPADGSKEEGPH